jgi:hypothetical protein
MKWQRSWQQAGNSRQQTRLAFMVRILKDLLVYQKVLEQAMRVFEVTKRFPKTA